MSEKVSILYCVPCGYERRARDAAAEIKAQLGVDVELIPGKGGVFKLLKGDVVLAQRTREHFPATDELVAILRDQ